MAGYGRGQLRGIDRAADRARPPPMWLAAG